MTTAVNPNYTQTLKMYPFKMMAKSGPVHVQLEMNEKDYLTNKKMEKLSKHPSFPEIPRLTLLDVAKVGDSSRFYLHGPFNDEAQKKILSDMTTLFNEHIAKKMQVQNIIPVTSHYRKGINWITPCNFKLVDDSYIRVQYVRVSQRNTFKHALNVVKSNYGKFFSEKTCDESKNNLDILQFNSRKNSTEKKHSA